MPEVDRQLHLNKVPFTTQIGFSMAKTPSIEFDIRRSQHEWLQPGTVAQKHPKPVLFYILFIT